MAYHIEKRRGESAYLQLYRQLRQEIVSGLLPPGTRLPSRREMAAESGLSTVTVEHAYALLEDEGYARTRPRSGCYVCFGGAPGQVQPRAALEEMSADLSGAEDFPFSVWAKTMRAVLADYDRRILVKSPNPGVGELRLALAEYLGRSRGVSVRPERIIVGSGAEYLYGQLAQLLGRKRLFALEDPCYALIRRVYALEGLRWEALRLGDEGILSGELERSRASVLHVTPYHSYPSGVTASAGKRHEYAAWAEARDGLIVEDDYDSALAAPGRQIETVLSIAPERVLYLGSFSKLLAPAMRTGFLVLPERLLGEYEEKLGFLSCTVPVFDQLVLAKFIRDGHMERYINRRRRQSER